MAAKTEGCDGAFWQLITIKNKEFITKEVCTSIYNFEGESGILPSEDHNFYKYNVLMIQSEEKTAEVISAYIGDVEQFITNQAKGGRIGLLIKKGVVTNRTLKRMFNLVLQKLEFPANDIKVILKQVN